MKSPFLLATCALFAAAIVLLASSCAGGGSTRTESGGRVVLTIRWPQTREIPDAARSIKVVAKVLEPPDGPEVGEGVAQRPENQPTSQIVLEGLPSVKVLLTATAHESTDGSGPTIASGTTEIQVPEDGTASANITLDGGPPDPGCPFFMARQGEESESGTSEIALGGASAKPHYVSVSRFREGSAEAHSDSVFVVHAPEISGEFAITLTFESWVRDNSPPDSTLTRTGSVTFTSPAGTVAYTEFMESAETVQHVVMVKHNDVLRLSFDAEMMISGDTYVEAWSVVDFRPLPEGVRIDAIQCE